MPYFEYGETEINYLKSKDKRLAQAIVRIGFGKYDHKRKLPYRYTN